MKILFKYLLISSGLILVMGAGCTQSRTNNQNADQTNVSSSNTLISDNTNTANTNEVVVEDVNTNVELVNENTNVDESNTNTSDDIVVDTSDWLTYTNEEYGFSFKYPADLGEVHTKKSLHSDKQVYIQFENSNTVDGEPLIQLFEDNHNIMVEGDASSPPNLTADSFDLEANEFADQILNSAVKSAVATEKFNRDHKYYSVEILGRNMAGEYSDVEAYIHSDSKGYYLVISQRNMNFDEYSRLIDSVRLNS